MGLQSAGDVTHRKDFGDFEKVILLSWVLPWKKMVGFRLFAEARPVAFVAGATRVGGEADGKARIERMCISLLMLKNL